MEEQWRDIQMKRIEDRQVRPAAACPPPPCHAPVDAGRPALLAATAMATEPRPPAPFATCSPVQGERVCEQEELPQHGLSFLTRPLLLSGCLRCCPSLASSPVPTAATCRRWAATTRLPLLPRRPSARRRWSARRLARTGSSRCCQRPAQAPLTAPLLAGPRVRRCVAVARKATRKAKPQLAAPCVAVPGLAGHARALSVLAASRGAGAGLARVARSRRGCRILRAAHLSRTCRTCRRRKPQTSSAALTSRTRCSKGRSTSRSLPRPLSGRVAGGPLDRAAPHRRRRLVCQWREPAP